MLQGPRSTKGIPLFVRNTASQIKPQSICNSAPQKSAPLLGGANLLLGSPVTPLLERAQTIWKVLLPENSDIEKGLR